jgi:hypothetical protein
VSQDIVGAAYDGLYILLFWGPGILVALLLGAQRLSHALPLGFLISAVLMSVAYTTTALARIPETFWLVSKLAFGLALLGLGAITLIRRPHGFVSNSLVMAVITVGAVIARNILRLDVRPQYSDQFVIGWISALMDSGIDPAVLGTVDYIKRSFIFPLILTAGRDGTITISLIPIIAILMLMGTYRLIHVLTDKTDGKVRISVFIAVVLLWASSSFFWGMFGYQNAHVLVALGVAVLLSSVFSFRQGSESPWLGPVSGFVAGFVIAQSRIEAVALALILMVPLLFFSHRSNINASRRALVAFLGPPTGFFLWLLTTDAFVFDIVPAPVVALIFVPLIALLIFPRISRPLGRLLIPSVFGTLIALTIWYLFLIDGAERRRTEFFVNTFLGDGMWGFGAWAFLLIVLVTSLWKMSHRDSLLLWVTAVAILFTIDVKIIDGLIEVGGVSDFRRGWTDSTNRAFFHLFAPLTATRSSCSNPLMMSTSSKSTTTTL